MSTNSAEKSNLSSGYKQKLATLKSQRGLKKASANNSAKKNQDLIKPKTEVSVAEEVDEYVSESHSNRKLLIGLI